MNNLKPFQTSNGFTLLEVLLAIGITAIIGISTYTLLSQTLRTRDHLTVQAEELRERQLATTIIQNDLRQLSSRIIRDQFGDFQSALKVGGYSINGFMEFTRNGLSNPTQRNVSNFQRISYQLDNERFVRLVWPVLDQAPDSTPREQVLFERVVDVEAKILSDGKWLDIWPPENLDETAKNLSKQPKAIALKIITENNDELRWLESIPGGE